MPVLTDEQYNRLIAGYNLADKIMSDPKTKRDAQKLVKALYPAVNTDDDLAEPTIAPLKAKIDALEKRLKDEDDAKLENSFSSKFDDLRDEGYTEDGIEKIKKLMVDRNNPDVDSAVALFEKQNPPAAELAPAIRSNDWSADSKTASKEDFKALLEDSDKWGRNKAAEVLNEFRQNGKASSGGEDPVGWGR